VTLPERWQRVVVQESTKTPIFGPPFEDLASVLLHLAYPERYPILDKRALHALGVRPPSAYSFRFWEAYVEACLQLAAQAGVDARTFDQALWQWSKEQGVPLY
jgi:hypothetical protein